MELKLNYNRMGVRPKGETWEWYTAETPLANLHVHNRTKSGKWKWGITISTKEFASKNDYDTLDEAYLAGRNYLRGLISKTLEEMSGSVR